MIKLNKLLAAMDSIALAVNIARHELMVEQEALNLKSGDIVYNDIRFCELDRAAAIDAVCEMIHTHKGPDGTRFSNGTVLDALLTCVDLLAIPKEIIDRCLSS